MQIERYELTLEIDDQDKRIFHSPARGALLHGLLMREVGSSNIHSNANAPLPSANIFNAKATGGRSGQLIYCTTVRLQSKNGCTA